MSKITGTLNFIVGQFRHAAREWFIPAEAKADPFRASPPLSFGDLDPLLVIVRQGPDGAHMRPLGIFELEQRDGGAFRIRIPKGRVKDRFVSAETLDGIFLFRFDMTHISDWPLSDLVEFSGLIEMSVAPA